jgi:tetratricopeptide (TPR) repeat protein
MTVDEAISRARKGLGPKDLRYAEALELGGEIAAAADMPNAADARFRAAIEVLEGAGIAGAPLAHALLHHGLFRRSQGDAIGAVRAFSAVVARAGEAPEARALGATALTEMGFVVLDEGQVASARAAGDRALEVFLSLGRARRIEVGDAMALVGLAALREGEASTAKDFLETACDVYRGTKAPAGGRRALAHHHLGRALAALGERAAARSALLDAIDLYREGSGERIAIEQEVLDLARG